MFGGRVLVTFGIILIAFAQPCDILGLVHIEVYAVRYSLYAIRFALRRATDDIQVMYR